MTRSTPSMTGRSVISGGGGGGVKFLPGAVVARKFKWRAAQVQVAPKVTTSLSQVGPRQASATPFYEMGKGKAVCHD